MSRNLVEIVRRHHEVGAPTALEVLTDFDILTTISAALGHDMGFAAPADVMDEVAALTPDWAGVSHERVGRRGLQWPVAADGTDSPILYRDRFALPTGRARLAALPYKPPGSEASAEFPLVLVTGRRLEHYNAGTMTRRTANLGSSADVNTWCPEYKVVAVDVRPVAEQAGRAPAIASAS